MMEVRFSVRICLRNMSTACTLSMVTIRITDVNDNEPKFDDNFEKIIIAEDSPVGTLLSLIHASDADSGINSLITYIIDKVRIYLHKNLAQTYSFS